MCQEGHLPCSSYLLIFFLLALVELVVTPEEKAGKTKAGGSSGSKWHFCICTVRCAENGWLKDCVDYEESGDKARDIDQMNRERGA